MMFGWSKIRKKELIDKGGGTTQSAQYVWNNPRNSKSHQPAVTLFVDSAFWHSIETIAFKSNVLCAERRFIFFSNCSKVQMHQLKYKENWGSIIWFLMTIDLSSEEFKNFPMSSKNYGKISLEFIFSSFSSEEYNSYASSSLLSSILYFLSTFYPKKSLEW